MPGRTRFVLALLLAPALAGACGRDAPEPDRTVPWFHAVPGLSLGRPDPEALRNRNGTPVVYGDAEYRRFWSEVAPLLEEWARDRRLGLNPNYVAAILAKESGFYPLAVSSHAAVGCAQLTLGADDHLLRMTRTDRRWRWMFSEVSAWPRHEPLREGGVTPGRLKRLIEEEEIGPHNEYLLNPRQAVRAAVFWLRLLEDRWTTDGLPDGYGSFARRHLNQGRPLTEAQLFDLITASYNAGYAYVRDLIEEHGTDWPDHLNQETTDYLERVRHFTLLYQQAGEAD